MFRIKDTSGRFWGGQCWTVEQAAQEYDTTDDLPSEVTASDDTEMCREDYPDRILYTDYNGHDAVVVDGRGSQFLDL